jgi:hypothetical protein
MPTEKPRNTFKSPFKRGARSNIGEEAYSRAEGRGGSEANDSAERSHNDAVTDKDIAGEQGQDEHDMVVSDIMGKVKAGHPEVAKRLHAALVKHLSASPDEANGDHPTDVYGENGREGSMS